MLKKTQSRRKRIRATAESIRLRSEDSGRRNWSEWGPYMSERQWGTVREDYSGDGAAWESFPHEHARSRAYRWGEDGLGGICDARQRLCLGLALWNGQDPILKERLFGLTNREGNHGEDVKELYYYLDATPTHSYLKMLYKYPQAEFPYVMLLEENARRGKEQAEFELLETGVFREGRYFDVFVEYAKAGPRDILMKVTAHNRGPESARLHVLPQLWFRNTWSWEPGARKPSMRVADRGVVAGRLLDGDEFLWRCADDPRLLFCDNETNARRHSLNAQAQGYFKDAFHEYVVQENRAAVNPAQVGTKAAAYYILTLPAGGSQEVRVRLTLTASDAGKRMRKRRIRNGRKASFLGNFKSTLNRRVREADAFYAELQRGIPSRDARLVQRQAFAGMIWGRQFYRYDVHRWLEGDPGQETPPPERKTGRNHDWTHLKNSEVLSMPDKWEFPWYAAWDLGFHCLPLAVIDPEFAKNQLVLLTREWYMHPNGQLPAYEWSFDDVNPPIHGWAAWRVFQIDRKRRRERDASDPGDVEFLERVFHKLLLNFTWWVNRKDPEGRNVFQGGFLGLDNIGVFDRSAPMPGGGFINQADATSWMAMYSLNLMRIALELALHNRTYEDIATKFFEHFLFIANAMNNIGEEGIGLWDETDGFYYDVLNLPDGRKQPLRLRSMVGLIPLFAVETLEPELMKRLPQFASRLEWFLSHRLDLAGQVSRWNKPGMGERRLLSLLRGHRMKCLLRRMLDEDEFLSPHGVRALSKTYEANPYVFPYDGHTVEVSYSPGESRDTLFGGNSNWRGPVWLPLNFLLIESIQKFHHYYGDDFKVEYPSRSGRLVTLLDVADALTTRLTRLFLRDETGSRPVFGPNHPAMTDPNFRDCILFHEYFHGDSGLGLGASHQTGWTGLIAKLIHPRARRKGSRTRRTRGPLRRVLSESEWA